MRTGGPRSLIDRAFAAAGIAQLVAVVGLAGDPTFEGALHTLDVAGRDIRPAVVQS